MTQLAPVEHKAAGRAADLSLSEAVRVLSRERLWVLLAGLLGGVLFYAGSFLIPPTFKASATLIPMSPRDALGSLNVLGVDIQSLGLGNTGVDLTPAMYPEMAKSRAVLEPLLLDTLYAPSANRRVPYVEWLRVPGSSRLRVERGLKLLRDEIGVTIDRRTGSLTISARDRDPRIAADVANSVADRLQDLVVRVLASHAGERRKFVEGRLVEVRGDLASAEGALQNFREQNLRIGNSPRLQLEESRLLRGVREQEEVYLTLSRERELAKIEEHRNVPLLASLDRAEPPVQRFWPRRSIVALLGAVLCSLLVYGRALYLEPNRS